MVTETELPDDTICTTWALDKLAKQIKPFLNTVGS